MHISRHTQISLILLAAGESSRLGTPKQLLMYKGKNLMQHTIDMALTLGMDTFIAVSYTHLDVYKRQLKKRSIFAKGSTNLSCGPISLN